MPRSILEERLTAQALAGPPLADPTAVAAALEAEADAVPRFLLE